MDCFKERETERREVYQGKTATWTIHPTSQHNLPASTLLLESIFSHPVASMFFYKTQRLCCSLHSSFTYTSSAEFYSQGNRKLTPMGPIVSGPCISHQCPWAPHAQPPSCPSVHWEHQVPSPSELLCSLCLLPKHRERDTQPKVSNWKEHLQNYLRRFHVISRNWQIEHQSNQNRVSLGKTEIHVSQPHSLNDGL